MGLQISVFANNNTAKIISHAEVRAFRLNSCLILEDIEMDIHKYFGFRRAVMQGTLNRRESYGLFV